MPRSELPTDGRPTETRGPTSRESEETTTLPAAGAAPDARPLPVIPGYRVVGRLGEGGMGEVYEVIDEKVAVRLALKMIRPDRVGAEFLARFRQEIRAMMLLNHPNIARIYGHGEVDGCPFFTMKFFAGGALASRQDEFRADARKAVALTAKVADAVAYLHGQGKIHRDLKLSNILLDEAGEPHLSDFGLVKEYGEPPPLTELPEHASTAPDPSDAETKPGGDGRSDRDALTRTGNLMGTYAYMSPEQTRGARGRVGLHSDVWALGVILYELLAGRKPFVAADTGELVRRINEETPSAPTGAGGEPDAELDAIVLKCLAKNAADRYASVGELAGALRGWLTKQEAAPSPPKKRPRIVWLAGAVLICLALLGAAVALRLAQKPADPDHALRAAQERLAAGREVEWIGPSGMPLWYRIRAGEEAAFTRLVWDDTFTVDSHALALVEICPDPRCDRYQFEAEVRQNNTDQPLLARVGLYFLHRTHGADQRGHTFAHWFFTEELAPEAWQEGKEPAAGMRAGRAQLLWTFVRAQPGVPYAPQTATDGRSVEFTLPQNADFGWRKLRADVGPEGVTVRFDGRTLTYDRRRLVPFASGAEMPEGGPALLDPRGGLGFYVNVSSASFRRVVVRPVAAE
jgi:serine/threonine protein kinase